MSVSNLRRRVLRAGSWALVGNLTSQLIRLGSNLVLTRLLLPDAFGLMALITVVMVGLAMLSDTGTSQALVRSPRGTEPAFRATVWAVQLIRGAVLCGACLAVAFCLWLAGGMGWLPAGSTYAHPQLPGLLAVYSVCPLIQGLASTKLALAQRELRIKDTVMCAMLSQALALPLTLALAWSMRSVWSLVWGSLFAALLQTVFTHLLIKGERDRLGWDKDSLKELASFGRWVLLASTIGFMASSGDRLLLSGLIDATSMGHYAIAFLIVGVVQTVFSLLLGSVVFPAISEVFRHNPSGLESTYTKFQRVADVMLLGGGAALAVSGPALIRLIYDHRYEDTGWMVSILAIGVMGMRFQVIEQCYLALGLPRLMTLANVLRIVALVLLVPLAHSHFGLGGAVWGIALSQYAGWAVAFRFRWKHRYSWWRADAWAPGLLVAGAASGWALSVLLDVIVERLR